MIEEFDQNVLKTDLPEHGLQQGNIGTVVLVHQGGAGDEVEFVAFDGETNLIDLGARRLTVASETSASDERARNGR